MFNEKEQVTFRDTLQLAWGYWKRTPGGVAFIGGTIASAVSLDVMLPFISREIAQSVQDGNHLRAGLMVGTFLANAAAFWVLFQMGMRRLNDLTLVHMESLVQDSFAKVQRASTDWHANTFAGSTMRKLTRGMWALDTMSETVANGLVPTFVLLGGSLGAMMWHHPLMGWVSTGTISVYIIAAIWLSRCYVAPANKLSVAEDSKLSGTLVDAITCNAAVKAFGAEAREELRLAEATGVWHRLTRTSWTRLQNMIAVMNALTFCNMAAIIGTPVLLWHWGQGGPADVAYGLTAYFLISGCVRHVSNHVQNMQKSSNDLEDVVRLFRTVPGVADKAEAKAATVTKGEVRFEKVGFSYAGQEKAIYRNLSVTIAPGETVGLVGASGSGKSTFVKLVQRLYDVTEGRVLIDGQDVRELAQSTLRARIALVPQEPALFHRSLAENIRYGRPDATEAEVERAARLAHADEFISRLPQGYATEVGERGVKLSGGERQRVAIARAILADTPILVLDEATSSLDSVSEAMIQDALERLMKDRTTIIVAHRLSTLRAVDRILVFDRGRIVEAGRHEELLEIEDGHYRRLYETQQLGLSAPELVD